MLTAKVINKGDTQLIHLPTELHLPEKEYLIRKSGNCLFLIPSDDPWSLLRHCIGQPNEDLSFDRNQPLLNELPEREPFL